MMLKVKATSICHLSLVTAITALTACGSDNSGSSTTTPPPDLGEPSDILQPLRTEGAMCPTLSTGEIKVLRNGNILTIKVPQQKGKATHNSDTTEANEAHCKVDFAVNNDGPFVRRLAGGSIAGRFAGRAKEGALIAFTGSVSQDAKWRTADGQEKYAFESAGWRDSDGSITFADNAFSQMGGSGNLAITVEVNAQHQGYPVVYEWDGIFRFEVKTPASQKP